VSHFPSNYSLLYRMGVSVLYGALTTVGSASMLLFCTILIFKNFGLIICLNLGTSMILSLTIFCAILSMFGPTGNFGDLSYLLKKLWTISKSKWKSSRRYSRVHHNFSESEDETMDGTS
jgi:uncharacterized membrane protein YdfJ with MMPL/SSD domain